jgi:hypothetical protein
MKKFFLTLWLLSFLGGGYYLKQNYTFVQLSSEQLAQIGSTTLQSSVINPISVKNEKRHPDVLFRVGSFAIVKNSSELLVPEQGE